MHKKLKKFLAKKSTKKTKWFNSVQWDSISEEKTNLAYNNAMKFLEDLDNSQKNLDSKALVFLSYLFTICGVLLYNLLFKNKDFLEIIFLNGMSLSSCILILCLGYAILFCLTAMIFLSTQRRRNRYANPANIFINPNNHTQYIKNDLCIGLEEAISFNVKKQNRRAFVLKFLLLLSVIFPIGLITYCMTQFCIINIVIGSVISLVVLWFLFRVYP
jgi:hypothetical protein